MKKLTAIVLALVIALSVAVTAFAATTYQCPYCFEIIEGEKKYNEHLDAKCPEVGKEAEDKEDTPEAQTCPYEGCGAKFSDPEQYEAHLDACHKKTDPTLAQQVEAFILDFSIFGAIDTVFDLLSKVNFPSILITIIDLLEKAVTAIIDAV